MPRRMDTINYYDPETGNLAQRQVEVEYREYPIKDEVVKIGDKETITLQIGPTPGNAFAIYSKNPAFHEKDPDTWFRAARQALEVWAGKGNRTVERIIPEHGRMMNMKLDYMV